MMDIEEQRRRLIESVMLLAQNAPEQLAAFPPFVAKADEVALTFDDAFAFAPHLYETGCLTDGQWEILQSMDERLTRMSGKSNEAVWSEQALLNDTNWVWLRGRAAELLQSLGVALRKPVLDWMKFVQVHAPPPTPQL